MSATQWVLDVRGPVGPLVAALAGLPVHDLVVDPFRLEDYIAQFYTEHAPLGAITSGADR
jgi:hypothetical protein